MGQCCSATGADASDVFFEPLEEIAAYAQHQRDSGAWTPRTERAAPYPSAAY